MEAASIEELHQKIQTLEKEKNKEEEYRNYMQLERVRFIVQLDGCRPKLGCCAPSASEHNTYQHASNSKVVCMTE